MLRSYTLLKKSLRFSWKYGNNLAGPKGESFYKLQDVLQGSRRTEPIRKARIRSLHMPECQPCWNPETGTRRSISRPIEEPLPSSSRSPARLPVPVNKYRNPQIPVSPAQYEWQGIIDKARCVPGERARDRDQGRHSAERLHHAENDDTNQGEADENSSRVSKV